MSDPIELPPGQARTAKFPVVGERRPEGAALDLGSWRLDLQGLVERPAVLAWDDYLALPLEERVADLHCVTGWSKPGTRMRGVPLARLLEESGLAPGARFVRFEAYSGRRHDTSLPLALALEDTWLVHEIDGRPLEVEHGFPLRTVTPSRYFYKSLKWLRRIEVTAEDRLGYWERESAYHNVGDPWAGDQRFTSGSIEPRELARLREARDLAPWRSPRRVVLSADLRDWNPNDRDLRSIQLKNCDLRGARLGGCDLRRANLSLSDLRGADLSGCDLRDGDLEGAHLGAADLTGADLSGCALSATRFVEESDGERLEARVDRLQLRGATGLLEEQEEYLRSRGAIRD
jgi:DMSO/TMAO reductase YedYZ molybdopterin-dependent catalytic subunit